MPLVCGRFEEEKLFAVGRSLLAEITVRTLQFVMNSTVYAVLLCLRRTANGEKPTAIPQASGR